MPDPLAIPLPTTSTIQNNSLGGRDSPRIIESLLMFKSNYISTGSHWNLLETIALFWEKNLAVSRCGNHLPTNAVIKPAGVANSWYWFRTSKQIFATRPTWKQARRLGIGSDSQLQKGQIRQGRTGRKARRK